MLAETPLQLQMPSRSSSKQWAECGGCAGEKEGERETNERENNYEREGEKRDMKEKITDNRRGNKIKTERRKPYFGIYSLKVSGHFMKWQLQ